MLLDEPAEGASARDHEDTVRGVMDALRRIVRDLRLSARGAERSAGMSAAQIYVLQSLGETPTASLRELSRRTLTDQSSVSVVVSRLVARKLVARKPSPDDARRVALSLTTAGRRALARCPEPTQVRLVAALERLSEPERSALGVGLTALVREMGLDAGRASMFFEEAPSRDRDG
ncbi:MAG TPA: MarR family transcriptional regulator [Polyangiaceae bacterium]|nr:MarR family transcriptional regulator [Polyangiaceae bacterium]